MIGTDAGREAIRFVPEDRRQRVRIFAGSLVLLEAASHVFSMIGKLGNRRLTHGIEQRWARAAARLLRLRIDIEGLDSVDLEQQYIVVSLHESLADAIALFHLGLPLTFLVRDELFDWRPLGRYLRATGQIRVEEDPSRSSLRAMYRSIEACLARNESLAIFAQGSVLGVEVAFRDGPFRIARRLGIPMLPVVLTGGHTVWEHPFSPTVRLDQEISVRVMPPVAADELTMRSVRTLERRMKRLALDPSTAPARRFEPDRDGWWDDYRYEIDPDFPALANRLARRRACSA